MLLRIHRFRLRRHYRGGSERSAKIDPNSDRRLADCRLSGVFRRCYSLDNRPPLLRARSRNPVSSSVREYRLGLGEMAGNHRCNLWPVFQVKFSSVFLDAWNCRVCNAICACVLVQIYLRTVIADAHKWRAQFLHSLLGAMFPLPRIIYAMASDGLIFEWMGKVNSRFHTPLMGTFSAGILTGMCARI